MNQQDVFPIDGGVSQMVLGTPNLTSLNCRSGLSRVEMWLIPSVHHVDTIQSPWDGWKFVGCTAWNYRIPLWMTKCDKSPSNYIYPWGMAPTLWHRWTVGNSRPNRRWKLPDFLQTSWKTAMAPTGALQLFVIWEVINSIEEFHEHLVHSRILSLILLGYASDTRGTSPGSFSKKWNLSLKLKGNMLHFMILWFDSWCCKPFGGIIDWTAAFVLIKHVGQQNPCENGFRLPAISCSGHCLPITRMSAAPCCGLHFRKKYVLTSSSWRPFSYDILKGTDLQRVSGRWGVPRFFQPHLICLVPPPHPEAFCELFRSRRLTGSWQGYCFHRHTPPRIDIPPTNAAIPFYRPSHQSHDDIHVLYI